MEGYEASNMENLKPILLQVIYPGQGIIND